METTGSYDKEVKEKHPEIQAEWVERRIANPYYTETQAGGRIGYYGNVPEPDKWTRVVVADGKLHNRFIDHKRLREPLNKSVT